jgi:hypothetical protein
MSSKIPATGPRLDSDLDRGAQPPSAKSHLKGMKSNFKKFNPFLGRARKRLWLTALPLRRGIKMIITTKGAEKLMRA